MQLNKKYAVIVNIFSLLLLSTLIWNVIKNGIITKIDFWISINIRENQSSFMNAIMVLFSYLGNPIFLLALSIILSVFLVYKKRKIESLLVILSTGTVFLSVFLLKIIIQRARPENSLVQVSEYSFPSGHAAAAILFFLLIIYIFKDDIKDKIAKNIFITAGIAFFVLVGFSRIYLNAHWFSDVIAGFSLAIFWLTLFILLFRSFNLTNDLT